MVEPLLPVPLLLDPEPLLLPAHNGRGREAGCYGRGMRSVRACVMSPFMVLRQRESSRRCPGDEAGGSRVGAMS